MANALKTLSDGDITREAIRILKNANKTLKKVNRQYDDRFARDGAKNGGTLLIREPNRYTVGTGSTISAGQDTTERTHSLVVGTQLNVPVEFLSSELTLSLTDFSSRILKPAMSVLGSDVARRVALAAAQGFSNYVGTPGTTPTSFLTFAQAGERLDWQTAPRDDRAVVLNPTAMAAAVDAQKGLFAPSSSVGDQYKKGVIEEMTGFDFVMDQALPTIAHGAGASYQTNLASGITNGATAIAVDVGTGALTAGQQFTIAGVYEVNPDTKASTGNLKIFTVNADYAGGAGNITVSEALYKSGAYQNFYHSGSDIPDNTALTLIGTASTSYVRNLAFHRDSIVLATADLEMPKGTDMAYRETVDGLSLRFVRDYNVLTDKFIGRFDILIGIKVVRPSWGVVVYG
jgi:hypothetical protein